MVAGEDVRAARWRRRKAALAWARVFQSMGLALLFIPINTAAYQRAPADKNGNASAIINMMRNIGGSVGIALLTTYIARREQANQATLVRHVTPYSPATDPAGAAPAQS